FRFGNPVGAADLVFVDLGGLGIRDLTWAKEGFLILAGPVGHGPGGYRVFLWDGRDCLPGRRTVGDRGQVRLLGEVPTPAAAGAEVCSILSEPGSASEILVVSDGARAGGATRFRATKS